MGKADPDQVELRPFDVDRGRPCLGQSHHWPSGEVVIVVDSELHHAQLRDDHSDCGATLLLVYPVQGSEVLDHIGFNAEPHDVYGALKRTHHRHEEPRVEIGCPDKLEGHVLR